MKILALDSSGLVASVAVVEDNQLLAEYTVNYKKTHSQTLLPMLDEIAKMIELDLETIDAIAVAAGPGSFTGLRIGSATAKGLGLALKKPLIPVPTVDALAYNLYDSTGVICPMMDARRKQGLHWNLPLCRSRTGNSEQTESNCCGRTDPGTECIGRSGGLSGRRCYGLSGDVKRKYAGTVQFCTGTSEQTACRSCGSIGRKILPGRQDSDSSRASAGISSGISGRAGACGKRSRKKIMKIREMQLDDLEQVMKIENENFSRPWTETGFLLF